MSLIGNEQAKLSATYLNGLAIAVGAVGGIAPWIALIVQDSGPGAAKLIGVTLICFSLSGALHYAARSVLRLLKS